jgi:hypothetical protein
LARNGGISTENAEGSIDVAQIGESRRTTVTRPGFKNSTALIEAQAAA